MNSPFVISDFSASDVEQVIAIGLQCGLSAWSEPDYMLEAARTDSIMLGCQTGGKLVGFIVGRRIPGYESELDAEIYNIGVLAEFRRRAIGKMLMSRFLRRCLTYSVHNVWLDVRTSNHGAVDFYTTFGFSEAYRRRNFYNSPSEDALVMQISMPLSKTVKNKTLLA